MPIPSRIRPPLFVLFAAAAVLAAAGCRGGSIRAAQNMMRQGRFLEARETLEAARGFEGPHEILGWLELGTALHETGRYAPSNRAFLRAEAGFDAQDRRPQTSISEELFAAVTSPLSAAYRGQPTDRVLAPTFRGLNSIMLGDTADARLAFNEAAIRQQQTLQRRAARIDEARALRSGPPYRGRVDIGRSVELMRQDPELAARFAALRRFEPYRGYVNPFAELLHAVFRLGVREDPADVDRAVALLRSVAGMVPENSDIKRTLLDAEALGNGEPPGPVTHVFFATGFCPLREPFRVDLPLFLVNDEVDYVGISFPVLRFDDDYLYSLDIETPDGFVRTGVVADMDRIVAIEFREELPVLMTRAVLAAAAKAAAAWGLHKATEDDETLNAVVRLAAGLYLYSQNKADTRSWASLPKQFQYARVPTPENGAIVLSTPDGQRVVVAVQPGADMLVCVRGTRPGVPLIVETAVLGGEEPR